MLGSKVSVDEESEFIVIEDTVNDKAATSQSAAQESKTTKRRPARKVVGSLPPVPSSTGRSYYAFESRHPKGPAVVCGSVLACTLLGGSWLTHKFGKSPEGFATFEDAANHLESLEPEAQQIIVTTKA